MSAGSFLTGDQQVRELSWRIGGSRASTTDLSAIGEKFRVDGMLMVVGQALYVFDADATVGGVAPNSGSGRWLPIASGAGGVSGGVLAVRNATTTALAAYTRTANVITADANGALGAIDGVTNVVGDRLLLKDGADGSDNGVYLITAIGGASAKYSMTRAPEFDSSAEVLPDTIVTVAEGTTLADRAFILSTNAAITLNTTSLTFTLLPSYTDLALTTSGYGADLIGIKDTHSKYTGTDVGTALDELATTTGAAIVGVADAGSHFAGATVEAVTQELGVVRVRWATKAFDYTDVAALGASGSGSIDFAAALPANAITLGGFVDVTAIFDNATDTASGTFDLGVASGDTDVWVDGGSLDAVAKVGAPFGVAPCGFQGGATPSVLVAFDVNCDTITKGSGVAYLAYVVPS